MISVLFSLLLFIFSAFSFANELPRVSVEAQGHTLYCELANTPETISKGLMFRTQLPADQGMLFSLPYAHPWSFWMKNTLIPLDIIWLNPNKKVVYIVENAEPCQDANCTVYTPPPLFNALYVLEIGGGLTKLYDISLGTKLNFETKASET